MSHLPKIRVFFSVIAFDNAGYYDYSDNKGPFPGDGIIAADGLSRATHIPLSSAIGILRQEASEVQLTDIGAATIAECISTYCQTIHANLPPCLFQTGVCSLFVQLNNTIGKTERFTMTVTQLCAVIQSAEIHFYIGFLKQAGEIPFQDRDEFKDSGVRYFMRYRESSQHHTPHVHAELPGKWEAVISIPAGETIESAPKPIRKAHKLRQAQYRVKYYGDDLLLCWNLLQNGINPDLNLLFGRKRIFNIL